MPDWNTRLEVRMAGKTVAPISQFTPTFNAPHTVIHSIDADNTGGVGANGQGVSYVRLSQ